MKLKLRMKMMNGLDYSNTNNGRYGGICKGL